MIESLMILIVIFPSNLPSVMPYHLKLWMLKLLAFRWRKENYKLKSSILTLFSFPSPWVIPTCGRGTSLWRRWWRWGWFFLQKMITLGPWVSSQPVLQIKSPLLYYKTEIMCNGKGVRSSSLAKWQSLTENEWLVLNARGLPTVDWTQTHLLIDKLCENKQMSTEMSVIRFYPRRHMLVAVWDCRIGDEFITCTNRKNHHLLCSFGVTIPKQLIQKYHVFYEKYPKSVLPTLNVLTALQLIIFSFSSDWPKSIQWQSSFKCPLKPRLL